MEYGTGAGAFAILETDRLLVIPASGLTPRRAGRSLLRNPSSLRRAGSRAPPWLEAAWLVDGAFVDEAEPAFPPDQFGGADRAGRFLATIRSASPAASSGS